MADSRAKRTLWHRALYPAQRGRCFYCGQPIQERAHAPGDECWAPVAARIVDIIETARHCQGEPGEMQDQRSAGGMLAELGAVLSAGPRLFVAL